MSQAFANMSRALAKTSAFAFPVRRPFSAGLLVFVTFMCTTKVFGEQITTQEIGSDNISPGAHRRLSQYSQADGFDSVKRGVTGSVGKTTMSAGSMEVDPVYPGTAVERMRASQAKAKSLTSEQLNGDWQSVRAAVLSACGLKDLQRVQPGQGYTGHCFNDFNHCDCTTMLGEVASNENQGQVHRGIALGNQLGPGIERASDPELGEGGSWCTCMLGSNQNPPQDVAHKQFHSRISFKLVWCPRAEYKTFVLVDDEGNLLNIGTPSGSLPSIRERQMNYEVVKGSKYSEAADSIECQAEHPELCE